MNISQLALHAATGPSDNPDGSMLRRKATDITATPDRAGHPDNYVAESAGDPPRGFQGPTKSPRPTDPDGSPTKPSLAGYYSSLRNNVTTAVESFTILTPLRARRTSTGKIFDSPPWSPSGDTQDLTPSPTSGSENSSPPEVTTPVRLLAPNGRLPSRIMNASASYLPPTPYNPPETPVDTNNITVHAGLADKATISTITALPNEATETGLTTLFPADTNIADPTTKAPPTTDNSTTNDDDDLNTKPPALPDAEFRRLRLLSQAALAGHTTLPTQATARNVQGSQDMPPTALLQVRPPLKAPMSTTKQTSLEASFARAVPKALNNNTNNPPQATVRFNPLTLPGALRPSSLRKHAPSLPNNNPVSPTVHTVNTTAGTEVIEDTNLEEPHPLDEEFPSLHSTTMRRRSSRNTTTAAIKQNPPSAEAPQVAPARVQTHRTTTRTTQVVSTTPPITHLHHAIVVIICRVDAEDSFNNFLDSIAEALAFLRKYVDPQAAFLSKPNSPPEYGPITSRETCPEVQFVLNRHYIDNKNPYAFANGTPKTTKSIRVSATLGLNQDPKPIFDAVRGDLMKYNISITYKPFQALDTVNRIVFLGAPQNANKHEAEETIYNILSALEQRRRTLDPDGFPMEEHSGDLPRFAIVSEQPGGMPYIEKKGAEKNTARAGPPREQRTLQILCDTKDYRRLGRLVTAAKEEKHWTREFGPSCHPTEVPDNDYTEAQRQRYIIMVETHRSSQLSAGEVPISGLRNADKEITLRRLPDAKNRPQPPATLTVKQIMRDMRFKGKLLWLCVLKADNGRYTGYFVSGDAMLTADVQAFLLCPGAQIYWYLLRRGYYKSDVDRLIRNTFNFEQQSLVADTKYNAQTRLAFIRSGKDEFMDIIQASYNADSGIDPTAGLTEAQIKLRNSQKEAVVGTLKANDINYYNFDDGQSITTVHTKVPDDDDCSIASRSLGETCFEPEDDTDEDEDEDAIDSEPTNRSNTSVQFVDLAGLADDPPTAQNNYISQDVDEETVIGEESEDITEEQDAPCFTTEMWRHYGGFGPDMIVTLNILLTELEIPDYDCANSSVPTHLRNLLLSETQGDIEVTHGYLMSIRESIEAGMKEQEHAVMSVEDTEMHECLAQLEDEATIEDAGRPATRTAEAVALEKPRGCAGLSSTSRPGVHQW